MLLGLSKPEIIAKIPEIIDFSELDDFIDEPINTYSSGMKARLGFSVAAYVNPNIILVDEVLGVGDRSFKQKSSKVMKEKIKSGKTVILVSHNEDTIKELCTRCVYINKGRTEYVGEVDQALQRYRGK